MARTSVAVHSARKQVNKPFSLHLGLAEGGTLVFIKAGYWDQGLCLEQIGPLAPSCVSHY